MPAEDKYNSWTAYTVYREVRTSVDRSNGDFTVHCWRIRDRGQTAQDRNGTTTHISIIILQIVILTNFINRGAGIVHLRCPYIFGTSL